MTVPVSSPDRAGAREALLQGLVDYAGLFPPAAESMPVAVRAYAAYRQGPDAWMLGRFIVPAVRLGELEAALLEQGETDWPVSLLCGSDPSADLESARARLRDRPRPWRLESLEMRGADGATLSATLSALQPAGGLPVFVEPAAGLDLPDALIDVLVRAGASAKLRMGGLVPEAFPPVASVARFVERCADARLPFKATAGLHHPVRSLRPLGAGPDAPRVAMHGFMNLFMAALLAWQGVRGAELEQVLAEEDPRAFALDGAGARWRDRSLSSGEIRAGREHLAVSFGSCSFGEPVTESREMGFL